MDTEPQGSDPFEALMGALDEPAEEVTATSGETEPETTDEAPQESEDAAPAPEVEEVEFDGKKLAIPKGTPPELVESVKSLASDLKADYTRKTQEVAEQRKTITARSEAIQQQESMLSANFSKAVEFKSLQEKMSQFEAIDWQALADQDPAQATKLNLAYQGLQRQAGTLHRELQAAESQRQQLIAQQQQAQIEQGQRELTKRIPKWSGELAQKVSETALGYGFTAEELNRVSDPCFVQVLHDAMQWKKLQADKPAAMQKVAAAPKVLKPGSAAPRQANQAALERLNKHGRIEDLARLL